jgi:DNA-binding winged helix-turn-helix (wHTH) protein
VTREEIKSTLSLNHTVDDFDQSINATTKTLRRALGDSADNPRYIETLGRRGYRLMPTIEYLREWWTWGHTQKRNKNCSHATRNCRNKVHQCRPWNFHKNQ